MEKHFVYIMASKRNGTLYIGYTNNLKRRVSEHKRANRETFTQRYEINKLVYYEMHDGEKLAFRRERQMKKWYRAWKIKLIEEFNPEWKDLYDEL